MAANKKENRALWRWINLEIWKFGNLWRTEIMTFDLMKYAAENACTIEVKPRFENYEKINIQRLVGWQVTVTKIFPDGNELKIKRVIGILGLTKEILDSMIAELDQQQILEYKAGHIGRQLRDREAFFKGE